MEIAEIIERLKKIPTGDLTDSMRRLGISGYVKGINCLQGKPKPNMVGPAITVQYIVKQPGAKCDFSGGQFAFAKMATNGEVIFIDAKSTECWLTGGNVCRVAELSGAAGIVVDGCIRDKEEIASHAMPVYCKGSGTKPYAEELQLAAVNAPIDIDGCRVYPGDIVVGDDDGVLVIPADKVEQVIYQAEDIADIEKSLAEAVERNASLEELFSISGRKAVVRG